VSDSLQNLIALRRIGVKPENIAFFADCTPATIKGLLAAGDSDDESKLAPKPLHHLFKEETIGEGGLQLMGYGHGESGGDLFPCCCVARADSQQLNRASSLQSRDMTTT
jgi:hypothetical protein